jgi:hypothetical protein
LSNTLQSTDDKLSFHVANFSTLSPLIESFFTTALKKIPLRGPHRRFHFLKKNRRAKAAKNSHLGGALIIYVLTFAHSDGASGLGEGLELIFSWA